MTVTNAQHVHKANKLNKDRHVGPHKAAALQAAVEHCVQTAVSAPAIQCNVAQYFAAKFDCLNQTCRSQVAPGASSRSMLKTRVVCRQDLRVWVMHARRNSTHVILSTEHIAVRGIPVHNSVDGSNQAG